VRDQEIKFGYAVTGEIDPTRVLTNAAARVGDVLILTKAIGTGIIATAIKFDRATTAQADEAIASMRQLNRESAEILRALPPGAVSGCTDVTGFALLGHASEMAAASHVTLSINADAVPLLGGAIELADGNVPGGGRTNLAHFGGRVTFASMIRPAQQLAFFDPQTSGGLLIAVRPDVAADLERRLREAGSPARAIGRVEHADPAGTLVRVE
jgi:selenide,water dikinase